MSDFPLPNLAPGGARHRYWETPPETLEIALGDLNIPGRMRSGVFDAGRILRVPCEEIFAGPVPGISLTALTALAPADVVPDMLDRGRIPANAAALALKYRLQKHEEIIEPPVPEPTPAAEPMADIPPPTAGPVQPPIAARLAVPAPEEPQAAPQPTIPTPRTLPRLQGTTKKPRFVPRTRAVTEVPEPPKVEEPAAGGEKKPFKFFSIFRPRTIPADPPPEVSPPVVAPAPSVAEVPATPQRKEPFPRVVLPKGPKFSSAERGFEPPTEFPGVRVGAWDAPQDPMAAEETLDSSSEEQFFESPTVSPSMDFSGLSTGQSQSEEAEPPLSVATPVVAFEIDVEHMDGNKGRIMVTHPRIQELFMTEEELPVERVIELCGGLPGIRACILSKGDRVVASHNVPNNWDIVSLTANATDMLTALRASTMRMGLGAIPAVTIHSERGPVSFFHVDDLALLVLHADRGFIPGVRERLSDVAQALAASNLPISLEGGDT